MYWVLALAVAATLAWAENRYVVQLRRLLIFLSLAVVYLALRNPLLLYHENLSTLPGKNGVYSNLLSMFSNSLIDLTRLLPALSNTEHRRWLPLLFWIPAILIISALFLKKAKPRRQRLDSIPVFSLICVLGFSFVFLGYAFFDIRLDQPGPGVSAGGQVFFQDKHHYDMEPEGFWTKGSERASIFLHAPTRLREISLLLSRPLPGIINAQVGKRKITSAIALPAGEKKLVFLSPVGFPWRGGYFYLISVCSQSVFVPARLNRKNSDDRSMGVFVRIIASN